MLEGWPVCTLKEKTVGLVPLPLNAVHTHGGCYNSQRLWLPGASSSHRAGAGTPDHRPLSATARALESVRGRSQPDPSDGEEKPDHRPGPA